MRAYGIICRKCRKAIEDTKEAFLVYAKNKDGAMEKLNPAIKEHDLQEHPTGDFAGFTLQVLLPR